MTKFKENALILCLYVNPSQTKIYSMQRITLVSFSSAPSKWYKSQLNLVSSAKGMGISEAISYTDINIMPELVQYYGDCFKGTRGFGFWRWKPFIIRDCLNQLGDGDIAVYVDSGNTIINSLQPIVDICNREDVVLFENRDGNRRGEVHKNGEWTKRDCFIKMKCDEQTYYDAGHVDASYQLFKKTPENMGLIEEYVTLSKDDAVITDSPCTLGNNLTRFIGHRHDQSILSLLAAKRNIKMYPSPSECGNHLAGRTYPQLFWHHRGAIFK